MAVSFSTNQPGSVMTAEGVHAVMQSLRKHLLAVGMEELPITGRYDASPEGLVDQVPLGPSTSRLYSPPMCFAFTDDRQSEEPIVISFRASRGDYFRSGTSGGDFSYPRYLVDCHISRGVSPEGELLGATINLNAAGGSISSSSYPIQDREGSGDYVSYQGDTLTVFIGFCAVTNVMAAGDRHQVFLHLERVPSGYAAIGTYGGASSRYSYRVYYSKGASTGYSTGLLARAGGLDGAYEAGTPVVAPVFSPTIQGGIIPLKKVFSAPTAIANRGEVITLDFSGAEKNYLFEGANYFQGPNDGSFSLIYELG